MSTGFRNHDIPMAAAPRLGAREATTLRHGWQAMVRSIHAAGARLAERLQVACPWARGHGACRFARLRGYLAPGTPPPLP